MQTIVIGADHAGYQLKERIKAHLQERGIAVEDVGCYDENSVHYPSIAGDFSQKLKTVQQDNKDAKGVLCCGSGIGISMSANRFPWIRAVVATDHYTARMSRQHNDANVICFGGRILAPELAADILDEWLATPFEGGRHQTRVDLMSQMGVPSC